MNLTFTEKKRIETKAGPRYLQTASPSQEFWDAWKEKGGELRNKGYSVSKFQGQWQVCLWSKIECEEQKETFEELKTIVEDLSGYDLQDHVKEKLLPFQHESASRLLKALTLHGKGLDASGLGTGKSFVALAVAKQLGKIPFVLCPKTVIPSWHRAASHFGIEATVTNYEQVKTGKTVFGKWVEKQTKKGKTFEEFLWTLPDNAILIFDECQKNRNSGTIQQEIGLKALEQKICTLGISATPADNPVNMRWLGQLTDLHDGTSSGFYKFMLNNGVTKGSFGMQFNGSKSILKRIHHSIFPEYGTKISKESIPDFPECTIEPMVFDCNGNGEQINRAYEEMNSEIARIEAREAKGSTAILAAIMYARQRVEMLKVPSIIELAETYAESGQSVAIFVNFRDTLQALREKLKTDCFVDGSQSGVQREACIQDFQDDKAKFIIVNIQSGGAGLSLHALKPESRPRSAIILPTWSGQDLLQATGRIWRAGATSKSQQVIFFANNSIESKICERVREKIQNITTLTDGDLDPSNLF